MKDLEFCRALYDFQGQGPQELTFKKGDLVAVLQKVNNEWWRGRLQNAQIGLFPSNYVEIVRKKEDGGSMASGVVGSMGGVGVKKEEESRVDRE